MPDPTTAEAERIVVPHFEKVLRDGHAPGVAYGVLYRNELLASGGVGESSLERPAAPHSGTVFRIASMTKSFTAATVLSLRDEGHLSLDDAASKYVEELRSGDLNAQTLTIRQLLTMSAGFPTDDPWGDRQQDLPHDEFRALLARPVSPSWRPGDRFEYSNLGYAVLGLVIESVTGGPYDQAVRDAVLDPLGMKASTFHRDAVADENMAIGYVKRSTGWHVEPVAGYGAFAPMGGLLTNVEDLAAWVKTLIKADTDLDHQEHASRDHGPKTSPTSLREMQRTQRLVSATAVAEPTGGAGAPEVAGYGFGLFEEFRAWGRTVFHSGGYPGYGSHMRWHPASGLGVIALANGTYAPMYAAAHSALQALVRDLDVPTHTQPRAVRGLQRAEEVVNDWLTAPKPDDDSAVQLRALFADNVDRDVPWEEREVQWHDVRKDRGKLTLVAGSRKQPSPSIATWRVSGAPGVGGQGLDTGELEVMVMMSPVNTEEIQAVTIKPVAAQQRPPMPSTQWI